MLEALLQILGLKKIPFIAGLLGGAISGIALPVPVAALAATWSRVLFSSVCGGVAAGYGGTPLALMLEKPDAVGLVSVGLGAVALAFVFKVLKAWAEFDLGALLKTLSERVVGGAK